jgi:hypothetical protein
VCNMAAAAKARCMLDTSKAQCKQHQHMVHMRSRHRPKYIVVGTQYVGVTWRNNSSSCSLVKVLTQGVNCATVGVQHAPQLAAYTHQWYCSLSVTLTAGLRPTRC